MNPPIRGDCGQSARHRIVHHLASNLLALLGLLMGPMEGALAFGPFPPGTTVFVDVANTSGSENGTAAHPFDTIGEGINAASAGAVVGVAPGVYDENPDITKPLQLIGYDAATTTIQDLDTSIEFDIDLIRIESANVRLAGFTMIDACAFLDPDGVTVLVNVPDPSVRIERSVLTGGCGQIEVRGWSKPGIGATIDRVVVKGNQVTGIVGKALITNSVIVGNKGSGIFRYDNQAAFIVNNTIVGNGGDGIHILLWEGTGPSELDVPGPGGGIIKNNIIAGNAGHGVVMERDAEADFIGRATQVPPHVLYNVFYDNGAGHYFIDDDLELESGTTLNSPGQINTLPGNVGNWIGDPMFVDSSAGDLHLTGGSPAIDAGHNDSAPAGDFDGNHRPQDGDGDCNAEVDPGAFEASPPPLPPRETRDFLRCQRYVFDPGTWADGGCIIIDCCPGCPGRDVLDWLIYPLGDRVTAFVLRFEGLDPAAARRVEIVGRGRWISADRLLLFNQRGLRLRGLPFPQETTRERLRMTVESFSHRERLDGRLALKVTQTVKGKTIAEKTLEYPQEQAQTR